MSYRIEGVDVIGEGPVLVLVNGIYQDKRTWLPLAEELAPFRKVVTFDFPQQGRSRNGPALPTIDDYVDYCIDVLDSLGEPYGEIEILGLSAACTIIRRLHCDRRLAFRRLYLCSPTVAGLGVFYEGFAQRLVRLIEDHGVEPFSDAFVSTFFSPSYINRNKLLFWLMRNNLSARYSSDVASLAALAKSTLTDAAINNPPTKFSSETHIFRGECDPMAPPAEFNAYFESCALNGNVYKGVFGGGHCFPLEEPAEFAKHLRSVMRVDDSVEAGIEG